MANEKYGSTMVEQTSAGGGTTVDTEDVFSGAPTPRATQHAAPRAQKTQARAGALSPAEAQHAVGEVHGDATVHTLPDKDKETQEEVTAHQEVGSTEAAEAGEEFIEATPDQLRAVAESGAETAVSDLRGIEGFEERESAEEGAAVAQRPLQDAGEAEEEAEQEFLPILAALAPTLISTIGPAVAKGVMSRLSPRARRVIQRIPPPVVTAAGTAAKAGVTGASGKSNLLALIAKLLQQAQSKPGGESGMELVDEAFVQEAAAAMEVIIGTDDRVRITQTTQEPWRRVCALRITFPSGATYRGTGFIIGPRAVATAGHCVYLHNQGGWARKVEVIPGANGSSRPFGQSDSASLRSVAGWVTGKKPESDYGCVVLPSGAFGGRNLGSFGFAAFHAATLVAQPAVLGGYPGDKGFAELWGMARVIKAVSTKTLAYDIDTVGGQSGAPVYVKRNGQRYVVGIHNYGAASGNSATRVTQPVYERLLAWSKL
ncbi:MAG: trypsin-like serine protease [Acidobacteria bacterium]|nr:trypsin-like serine protease [Acidobacteriota bacterium]MCA1650967.1 trypsin-like serine protease [Acidobacteriota bacterium]